MRARRAPGRDRTRVLRARASGLADARPSAHPDRQIMLLSRDFAGGPPQTRGPESVRSQGTADGAPVPPEGIAGRLASGSPGNYTNFTSAPGVRWGSWNVRRRRDVRETRAGGMRLASPVVVQKGERCTNAMGQGRHILAVPVVRGSLPSHARGAPPSSSFPSFPASRRPLQACATAGGPSSNATLEVPHID